MRTVTMTACILAAATMILVAVQPAAAQLQAGNYDSVETRTLPGAAAPETRTKSLCIPPDQTEGFFPGLIQGFAASRGSNCRIDKTSDNANHVVWDFTCKDTNGDDAVSHMDFTLGNNRIDGTSSYTAMSNGERVTVTGTVMLTRTGECKN